MKKSLSAITVGMALSMGLVVGPLAAGPSEATTTHKPAASSNDVSPLIVQRSCSPYNGYVIFYNNLGNKCFEGAGSSVWTIGFTNITAMCGGNWRGYFQWDSPDGRNWVTYYERHTCYPVSASSTIYKVVIY